jgi:hypothetical protein
MIGRPRETPTPTPAREFVPRPWQPPMIDFALSHKRCNILARMGMGKSSAILAALDALMLSGAVNKPLVLAPLRVARSTWPEEARKWEQFEYMKIQPIVGQIDARKKALLNTDAEIFTVNYDVLPWLVSHLGRKWPFDCVVADECFEASTPILTQQGLRRIDSVLEGELVATAFGFKRVSYVFKKKASSLVRLHLSDGRKIVCTPTHSFWAEGRWTASENTTGLALVCSTDVQALRRAIRNPSFATDVIEKRPVLQSVLLDLGMDINQAEGMVSRAGHERPVALDQSERILEFRNSDARVDTRKAVCARPSSRRSVHVKDSRREWNRHERLRSNFEPSSGAGMVLEHVDQYESVDESGMERFALELQTGFRMAGAQDLLGSGWSDTQHKDWKRARHKEDRSPRSVRVDRVENIECGGSVAVWDLEVEDAHHYFANGILVHNCTKLKNHRLTQGGQRAQALSDVAFYDPKKPTDVLVDRWINLSGTFSPNGLADVWGPMWFLDQGSRLGRSYSAFENRWFGYLRAKDAVNAHKTRIKRIAFPHTFAEITGLIKDVTISFDPKDWFDVKYPIVERIYVDLPPTVRGKYRAMEREMFTQIAGYDIEAFASSGKVIKCLQLANGAVYTGSEEEIVADVSHWVEAHDEKLQAVEEVIEEAQGAPVMIVYHFKPDLVRLKKRFPEGRHIHTKQDEDDFKAGLIEIAFVHAQSIGHGVDGFQNVCNIIVFFAISWDLETHDQIIERIGPMRQMQAGLDREVMVYLILARNTVDELVDRRLVMKRATQDATFDSFAYKPPPEERLW